MFILMSICLLSDPSSCREERLSLSFERINAQACLIQSQGAIAEWQLSHPEWRVKRWQCAARGAVPAKI